MNQQTNRAVIFNFFSVKTGIVPNNNRSCLCALFMRGARDMNMDLNSLIFLDSNTVGSVGVNNYFVYSIDSFPAITERSGKTIMEKIRNDTTHHRSSTKKNFNRFLRNNDDYQANLDHFGGPSCGRWSC